MDKKTGIIIGAIILAFGALIGISMLQNRHEESYLAHIQPASEESGNIPENIEGNPDAPVLIFEYADYQCEGCAAMNPKLNQLVEEYDGKVAVVYRGYVQSYHANGTAAAAAANAAALQGYWREFKDVLFANQEDWFYSDAAKFQEQLEKYFQTATNGKGDLAQFKSDMNSAAVTQKIAFDRKLCEDRNLEYTPLIYIGDTQVKKSEMGNKFLDNMRAKIDAELEKKGQK